MKHGLKPIDIHKITETCEKFATEYEYEFMVSSYGSVYFFNSPSHCSFSGRVDTLSDTPYNEQILEMYKNR